MGGKRQEWRHSPEKGAPAGKRRQTAWRSEAIKEGARGDQAIAPRKKKAKEGELGRIQLIGEGERS